MSKINVQPGTYRVKETYPRIGVQAPGVFSDALPNKSDILSIAELWDGGISEAHLFIQKNQNAYILYEVIVLRNAGSIRKYTYVMQNTGSMGDIAEEIAAFCKIRYAGTMRFDFNALKNNTTVSNYFDL